MIYAQIKDGMVKNTIVLEDLSLLSLFEEGFDLCLRVDNLDIIPSINWSYDGANFSPPPPVIEDDNEQ